ncbi:MAG: phosphatidylglycerophosphatase A [Planctomycetaceae bacterium]
MTEQPEKVPRLNWLDQLALGLATGLGVGYFPIMPGTVGSLWGPILVWGLLQIGLPVSIDVAVCVVFFLIGLPICRRAVKVIGKNDPGCVVYDEIAAFPLVFAATPPGWTTGLIGFLWFRIFDILKPWPIRKVEKLHGAWGVMADDLVAGGYAAIALWGTVRIFGL